MQRVPIINLEAFISGTSLENKFKVVDEVDSACRDLGFLVVRGHGVPPQLIEAMHNTYMQFYSLPFEEKMEYAIGKHSLFAGYVQPGNSNLAKSANLDSRVDHGKKLPPVSAPDMKESFGIGPPEFPDEDYFTCDRGQKYFQVTPWPESKLAPGIGEALRMVTIAYWRHMEQLTGHLLRAMALALKLPEGYFEPFMDRHISHLFVQHYPRQEIPPLPGQIRAGAHTDFGALTLLHLGSNPEGLEVFERAKKNSGDGLQEEGEDGVWSPVSASEDCFVVNLGDLMQQWTNDVWRSTIHRVVNPKGVAQATSVRQTITFFSQPNYDALISCIPTLLTDGEMPKFKPITSGEHYDNKITASRQARLGS